MKYTYFPWKYLYWGLVFSLGATIWNFKFDVWTWVLGVWRGRGDPLESNRLSSREQITDSAPCVGLVEKCRAHTSTSPWKAPWVWTSARRLSKACWALISHSRFNCALHFGSVILIFFRIIFVTHWPKTSAWQKLSWKIRTCAESATGSSWAKANFRRLEFSCLHPKTAELD